MSIINSLKRYAGKAAAGTMLAGSLAGCGGDEPATSGVSSDSIPYTALEGKYFVGRAGIDGGTDPLTGAERTYWTILTDLEPLNGQEEEIGHLAVRARNKAEANAMAGRLDGQVIQVTGQVPDENCRSYGSETNCVLGVRDFELDDPQMVPASGNEAETMTEPRQN